MRDGAASGHYKSPSRALDVFVIALDGDFDISSLEDLIRAFRIAQSAPLVVIDFAKVSRFDISALQCLAALQKETVSRGARLVLAQVPPYVRNVFRMHSLEGTLDIRTTVEEVVRPPLSRALQCRRLMLIAKRGAF